MPTKVSNGKRASVAGESGWKPPRLRSKLKKGLKIILKSGDYSVKSLEEATRTWKAATFTE